MESGMSNLIEKVYKDRDLKTTEEKNISYRDALKIAGQTYKK